ncbi:CusA/CzcA family heavy metal efflux RND transporter [Robiginitalea aurantiaca]|uniref:CusA/CzcA family heavy metal efflux RND transporter n=1 Tax=Robiginitalea aurantiaca TaxID=3056915 RepID=A0ABT7WB43_9FLAO|nr:CusA/CzcA family heavy metal efflux RND transporter [Robiginitalea aurantiaca]MDM9630131.1 CusA/CzcA family heavy metal efflux RND transporter [Robiginitalea aurantiaca]
MLSSIIHFSLRNKFAVLLLTFVIAAGGLFSLWNIPIGAVPDITNNQVQVITTSRNLSTQDMERFITYPVELEMANLPGVQEIRSVSKFGLSVVTIVFEDDMGTYLPRQLIAEKIQVAREKIPEGFGTPQMGPISTGLGEIYQYTLDVKPGFKDRYDAMDLRTIQDWIVKRQLAGIPGVVEVNTWGGHLKQYEIAIRSSQLRAMDITAGELIEALEKGNSVAGGGYIEKVNQAYFIRGEGLIGTLEDIENTVVKTVDGTPVFVRDVGVVGYGSATRFGAITGNGEGEKVLGQVMMLKGADSKEVINAVKERVAVISKSLPEGVYINAFLERSELISRTTFTITENLVLGCLIVIFVVVLLLGNFRSGMVVASVIPLSLLFALSMMYLTGVDANLMSLGAIDFGIIIDGAVIIVEFIAFQINTKKSELLSLKDKERRDLKDKITLEGASKLMNSAVFGQLIILIVFIPILSLSGVEGKMFRPMAMTFSFALVGAMILCFTYVPVMSSWFIKPVKNPEKNISLRLIGKLNEFYVPVIRWALAHKGPVLGMAAVLLVSAGFIFARMGGEFIPTLDEGDFVIQPVLKTGTSLSKTIETTTQIENILIAEFPEVDQVVTRIGAAEVPTDPMSMEESDVIITLKPKKEWVSADSKDELAGKFKEALEVIPGMEVEFTQPIEMRFNELITGVRADIAVKIFGEDLSVLARKGEEIRKLAEQVPGAADITVEKVEGLPQMRVVYNRSKISRYGLHISEVNELISMAFGGQIVGNVFEGEKRFDMVVRLNPENRRDLTDLQNLFIDLPGGGKLPLSEVAEVSYQQGAAKISRDDTRRRIVVGINVRDRDLQSVVDELRSLVEAQIQLPPGYTITYGGQFENLQTAKSRLAIAVPISLILIFVLLYFAFKSLRDTLIIFSAIPLSAVGGVLLLWLRDMPFSISAGVGFIALFGIAVLNGIVLIEHFKELKTASFENLEALITQGAQDRMRAVLLTASAAALGFLPMAVSTSSGAEVQRPLATVVIGGLITSTLLTLVVLPVLYALFSKVKNTALPNGPSAKTLGIAVLLLMLGLPIQAQEKQLGLKELLELAGSNNPGIRAAEKQMEAADARRGTALDFGKTEFFYNRDEANRIENLALNVFGVKQEFDFPTVYGARRQVQNYLAAGEKNGMEIRKKEVFLEVSSTYNRYLIAVKTSDIYRRLDSLYNEFERAASRRFELGATNYLEKITATSKSREIRIQLEEVLTQAGVLENQIQNLVQAEGQLSLATPPPLRMMLEVPVVDSLPEITRYENQQLALEKQFRLEQQQLLPAFYLQYLQGDNGRTEDWFRGYSIGLKIPLLFNGQSSRIRTARLTADAFNEEQREYELRVQTKLERLRDELEQQEKALRYYEEEGLDLSEAIIRTAESSYRNGEIDFFQYILSLENGYEISLEYLKQLELYNEIVLQINYLTF